MHGVPKECHSLRYYHFTVQLANAKHVLMVLFFAAILSLLITFLYLHHHVGVTGHVDQGQAIWRTQRGIPTAVTELRCNHTGCWYAVGSAERQPEVQPTQRERRNAKSSIEDLISAREISSMTPNSSIGSGSYNATSLASKYRSIRMRRSKATRRCEYTPSTMTSALEGVLAWTLGRHSTSNAVAMPQIFISVKAAAMVHVSRMSLLTATWMQKALPEQIHIVSDTAEDQWTDLAKSFGFNVKIDTSCPTSHTYHSLCCKSGVQFDQYYTAMEQGQAYKWWCQFDDDTYVNIPALVGYLSKFNPEGEKLYLGHYPSRWMNRKRWVSMNKLDRYFPDHMNGNGFHYATGAAYCISLSLMADLEKFLRGGNMVEFCEKLQLSDDLAIGIAVESILGYKLLEVPEMLSHIEDIRVLSNRRLKEMISVGFDCKTRVNVRVAVFTAHEDPSGFLSYHCLLFPDTPWCDRQL